MQELNLWQLDENDLPMDVIDHELNLQHMWDNNFDLNARFIELENLEGRCAQPALTNTLQ